MAKSQAKVSELVGMIERGEIRLPEMQRRYVWRAPRVRDLLDSLYRGYPSGAILLWETDMEVPERDFSVTQQSSPYATNKLLLDGQQRLTSLSSVIRGEPVSVRGRKKPIDILFNLEHPDKLTLVTEVDEGEGDDELLEDEHDASDDEIQKRLDQMTFVVGSKKIASLPHWVSVTEVFKSESETEILKQVGITSFDDPRLEKYQTRLRQLKSIVNYEYRLDILERTLSYEEVTEIFVRVNSLGAKLRGSDLALAQITAKWRDSLKIFESFQAGCADRGFDSEIGTFVRTLVCFATGQSRFLTVNSLSLERLQDGWERAKSGLEYAINYLRSNIGVDSSTLLSSPYFLILLAVYGEQHGYEMDGETEAGLRRWFLAANAKGRYSRGSSESMLDQDLGALRRGLGVAGLIDNLKQQFGRVEIEADDLVSRSQRSGYFKTMFLAFRHDGARDWHSRLAIDFKHQGSSHKLQFHHIFPQAYLKGSYENKQINDIANLSFIGGKTNRRIRDKAPDDYLLTLSKEHGPAMFDAQCVPLAPELLQKDAYLQFMHERRQLIAQRLNKFLNGNE
ncbi:DUF262 domain-containing protein [Pseudomaricurvus sp. HS19]|uniref:GmrSD restriction endonuclease domain-containing protein n=1 Tax=Pseudomaricurvus sp. HS19 TaxID=2692626 RepID=UPI00136E8752|nr:DUF262 domain-containing protein [Pseudomaricurvus sp. HS19]